MISPTGVPRSSTRSPWFSADPFELLLTSTMVGGTSLLAPRSALARLSAGEMPTYVSVQLEVILDYERTILELRRELLHYRRLLAQLQQQGRSEEYLELRQSTPLNAASIRLLNSIITSPSATQSSYQDFEE